MPAKGTKPVTKDVFDAVMHHVTLGNPVLSAAHENGIKPSTVRAIRQAKTWTEFERRKAARVTKTVAARKAKQTNHATHIKVASRPTRAEEVKVKRPAHQPAPKAVSLDDVEFQHPATKGDLTAMENRLQKHLASISDVLTTHARNEAIRHANVQLTKPELHISRRLDNMDQSLIRIERILQPVRRWFRLRRHG